MQNLAYRSAFDLALQAARKLAATELEDLISCLPLHLLINTAPPPGRSSNPPAAQSYPAL